MEEYDTPNIRWPDPSFTNTNTNTNTNANTNTLQIQIQIQIHKLSYYKQKCVFAKNYVDWFGLQATLSKCWGDGKTGQRGNWHYDDDDIKDDYDDIDVIDDDDGDDGDDDIDDDVDGDGDDDGGDDHLQEEEEEEEIQSPKSMADYDRPNIRWH